MNDSDPSSLNDDFIRTFTVSSVYKAANEPEFELVVRNVGSITKWLSFQNDRGNTKVGVKGFAGDFKFEVPRGPGSMKIAFIAAGIGITPLLGQINVEDLNLDKLLLIWTLGVIDIGLAENVLQSLPWSVRQNLKMFVTGTEKLDEDDERLIRLKQLENQAASEQGLNISRRRLTEQDLIGLETATSKIETWYLCTSPAMRKVLQQWLGTRTTIFENFDY